MSPSSTDVVLVLTTLGVGVDASAMASALVGEHLAACVSVLPPMTSVYRWQGRVERGDERQLVIKTTRSRLPALEARVRELHPYEVPEFLVVAAESGSAGYLRWVGESVAPALEPRD